MRNRVLTFLFGCILFSLNTVAQIPLPAGPQVTNVPFHVSDSVGCAPLIVEFSAESMNGVSWKWTFGNGNVSDVVNPSVVYNTPGNYDVSLIIEYDDNTIDTFYFEKYITILESVKADFEVSNPNTCFKDTVVFKNKSIGTTKYIWDLGNGLASFEESPKLVYDHLGEYSVRLIAENNYNCKSVLELDDYIKVNALPEVKFTVNNKCDTLTASSLAPDNVIDGYLYNWTLENQSYSNKQNINHVFNTYGEYNVALEVVDDKGCSASVSKKIVVNKPIVPEIYDYPSELCAGNSMVLKTMNTGFSNVFWDITGKGSFNGSSVNVPFNEIGEYDINIKTIDVNGCAVDLSLDQKVNVLQNPIIDAYLNTYNGCEPLNIEAENLSAETSDQISWSLSNGQKMNGGSVDFTIDSAGLYSLTISSTNTLGCTISKQLSEIEVYKAYAGVKIDKSIGCAPHTVTLEDTISNNIDWEWRLNNQLIGSDNQLTHTFNDPGVYSIELIVTNEYGCSETFTLSDFVTVTSPSVIYQTPDTIAACNSIELYFIGTDYGVSSWNWDFGNGATSTEANPVHQFSENGLYNVNLFTKDKYGCDVKINNYNIVRVDGNNSDIDYTINCSDKSVQFTSEDDLSWAYEWDFGDGNVSTESQPSNTYEDYGFYIVNLKRSSSVSGCSSSIAKLINISSCYELAADSITPEDEEDAVEIPIDAEMAGLNLDLPVDSLFNFNGEDQNIHCVPFKLIFEKPVDSALSVTWDFGDGTIITTSESVSHTYTQGGVYDLKMIINNANSLVEIEKSSFIKLSGPKANFDYTQNNLCKGALVKFDNSSDSLRVSTQWNFGDGIQDSVYAPSHVFSEDNNYFVQLSVVDEFGCEAIKGKNVIAGSPNPVFEYEKDICIGQNINFSSNVNGYAGYKWDFGDGVSSTDKEASHQYEKGGFYEVKLITFDNDGCSAEFVLPYTITVNEPIANFETPNASLCESGIVAFINKSTGASTYSWNFSDLGTSNNDNPSFNFENNGVFDVQLIASISGCNDTLLKKSLVTVYDPVKADFEFEYDDSCFPIDISFKDKSKGAVAWNWNFGDGGVSDVQHPSHTLATDQATNIKLVITDVNGCSSEKTYKGPSAFKAGLAIASEENCFPREVQFKNNTNDLNADWYWEFGDGKNAKASSPLHIYDSLGTYLVTLTAISDEGCESVAVLNNPIIVEKPSEAKFSSDSTFAMCPPFFTSFIDESINANYYWWDFGDGESSIYKDNSHIYQKAGTYDVSLVVSADSVCFDTLVVEDFIIINGPYADYEVSTNYECDSALVNFTNNSLNTFKSKWYFGDGKLSSEVSPSHSYSIIGSYPTTLIVYDSLGCQDFISLDTIEIHKSAKASFVCSDLTGCVPTLLKLDNNSEFADSYSWTFPELNQNTNAFEPARKLTKASAYNIMLVAKNNSGCNDTAVHVVNIYDNPKVNFTTDSSDHCFPASFDMENLSDTAYNVAFTWNDGKRLLQNVVSPTFSYSAPGNYDIALTGTNKYGCSSTLVKKSFITLNDTVAPHPTKMELVSVKDDHTINVKWKASIADDFYAYVVYYKSYKNSYFVPYDTLYNKLQSNIEIKGLNTNESSYCVYVKTIDLCGNVSSDSELKAHCSVLLKATPMEQATMVSWSKYNSRDLIEYQLYKKDDYSNYVKIAELDKGQTQFLDSSFTCPDFHSFMVKAILDNTLNNGPTRASDPIMKGFSNVSRVLTINEAIKQQKPKIVSSTVVDNNSVYTEWLDPEFMPEKIVAYAIKRSLDKNKDFEMIEIVPAGINSYLDNNVDVSDEVYYYKIESKNVCDIASLTDDLSSSILLQGQVAGEYIRLQWTGYEKWQEGVSKYIIEKRKENGEWEKIGETKEKTIMDKIME